MADLLRKGADWLAGKLQSHAGELVVYRRGVLSVEVTASVGKTLLKLNDGVGGVRMEWTDADFIIPAALLILGGSAVLPARGDKIIRTLKGKVLTYEPMASGGEPPWRWSDGYQTLLRVHTKQVKTEVAP